MSRDLTGVAASPGISIGKVVIMNDEDLSYSKEVVDNPEEEKQRFHDAVATSREQLEKIKEKVNKEMGADEAEIFCGSS